MLFILILVGFIVTNELHSSEQGQCFRIIDKFEYRCYIVDDKTGFAIFGPKRTTITPQSYSEIQNLLKIQKEKDKADAIQKKAFENAGMTSRAYYAQKQAKETK